MTLERRTPSWFRLAGASSAGVVLAHWLTYVVAVSDPHARAGLLAVTGHGYWLGAVKAAVILGLAAVGAALIRGLSAGRLPVRRRESYTWLALRLTVLQVVSFVLLEMSERLVAGAPVGGVFHDHILVVGMAIQVLVACAGALVLVIFVRAGVVLGRLKAPRPAVRPRPRSSFAPRPVLRAVAVPLGASGVRGPPASS